MSEKFMGSSELIFSNPVKSGFDDDVLHFTDADMYNSALEEVRLAKVEADEMGVDLFTYQKIKAKLEQKERYTSEPLARNYTTADTPIEVQQVGSVDSGVESGEDSVETRKVDNTWKDLNLPVRSKQTYIHGKQTYDKDGSVRIKLDSGVNEDGELNVPREEDKGRPQKLVLLDSDETILLDESLNKKILHNKSTGAKYLPLKKSQVEKDIRKQLAPEGLKEGQLIVMPLDEQAIKMLNFEFLDEKNVLQDMLNYPIIPPEALNELENDQVQSIGDTTDTVPNAPVFSATTDTEATEVVTSVGDWAEELPVADSAATVSIPVADRPVEHASDAWIQEPEQTIDEIDAEPEAEDQNIEDEADSNLEKPSAKREAQSAKAGGEAVKRSLKETLKVHPMKVGGSVLAIIGLATAGYFGANKLGGPSEPEVEMISNIETLKYEVGVDGVNGLLKTEAGGVESPTANDLQAKLSEVTGKEITRTNLAASWAEYVREKNKDLPDDEKRSEIAPDSFSASSVTIELSYDAGGNLIKDIDQESGTAVVNLDELDVSVDSIIDAENAAAHAIPLSDKIESVSDSDREAYNNELAEKKDEINSDAAKQAELPVSSAIIAMNQEELTDVVKDQITQSAEANGIKIEYTGNPSFAPSQDDVQKASDTDSFIKGVDAISIESSDLIDDVAGGDN